MSQYAETAAERRMSLDTARNGGHTIKLHFAHDLNQIDERTVEIIVVPGPDPFTPDFKEAVRLTMGSTRGDVFLEELTRDINRRAVLDGITLR